MGLPCGYKLKELRDNGKTLQVSHIYLEQVVHHELLVQDLLVARTYDHPALVLPTINLNALAVTAISSISTATSTSSLQRTPTSSRVDHWDFDHYSDFDHGKF